MNLLWLMEPPGESSIDALNTATPNLADKPTLADGPEMTSYIYIYNYYRHDSLHIST